MNMVGKFAKERISSRNFSISTLNQSSRVVTGRGQGRVPQVVADIKMRVVDPHRPPQLKRYRADTLAVPRNQVQLRGDQLTEIVVTGFRASLQSRSEEHTS